jgi:hypothetical protein
MHKKEMTVVTHPAEARHIGEVLTFDASVAPHMNWESIARNARELGAHLDARYAPDGACTVTLWWPYANGE